MTRHSATQLTLGLFDSTALTGGLGLPLGGSVPCFRDEDDEPTPVPETVRVPATNFRLQGDRGLAQGWKNRAADNIAAARASQPWHTNPRRFHPVPPSLPK